MNSGPVKRKQGRVQFTRGVNVQIVSIDGTWSHPCTMLDVSEVGAKLALENSIENLRLKEFFLVLSSTGSAFRRCELSWVNGDQIGVHFIPKHEPSKGKKRAEAKVVEEGGS